MATRSETHEIKIDIKAAQGVKEYRNLSTEISKLNHQLKALERAGKKNTEEYKNTAASLDKVNKKMAELGGKGATLGQLRKRAADLRREIHGLAPGTKRFIEAHKGTEEG